VEIICEEIAHQAGFIVSTGNWIAPDGGLILGKHHDEHHWETMTQYLGYEPKTENSLQWMNEQVSLGFIRLVFRADVMFQVGCVNVEDIWSDTPNYRTMLRILEKLKGIGDVHIFSHNFYIIGKANDITKHGTKNLQIKVYK
jgi:hypothetical protein